MSAPLPPAVSAALAALEAASDENTTTRADKWLAVARAWTEAAAASATGGRSGGIGSNDSGSTRDATECHERAYTAYATGLRELGGGGPGASASPAADALSAGRMAALAALAAVPPADPAPLPSSPPPPPIKRVYVVSDLHVDQPLPWRCDCFEETTNTNTTTTTSKTGMDWVRALPVDCADAEAAAIVVAGDCADSLHGTLSALAELKRRYARVFFCPGNHDLYLRAADAQAFPDSWCKLFALRRACARLGVETSPAAVAAAMAGGGAAVVVIVAPLLSWYDDGDFCGQSPSSSASSSSLLRYDAPCSWGPVRDADVHRVFLSLAKRELATAARAAAAAGGRSSSSSSSSSSSVVLVTATHFLPRPELPFRRGVMERAMGCALLGSAVLPALAGAVFSGAGGGDDAANSNVHIHAYGHSHVHRDRDDLGDGVRYVSRALGAGPSGGGGGGGGGGTPSAAARSACRCFEPLLVWEEASS